jgi:hypothetical protein
VKYIDWSELKNAQLRTERGVGFEDVLGAISEGRLLDDLPHLNSAQYEHQRLLVVAIDGYAFVVPYVEDEEKRFFKTIYPSRRFTAKYLPKRRT